MPEEILYVSVLCVVILVHVECIKPLEHKIHLNCF
jgi:hypothetical protein